MLNMSADCLADAKADAAVARVKCAQTSELAERRVGERIHQVEAKMFRAGWTRLRVGVGGRGGKRRAEGAEASLLLAAAAEADDAPLPPRRVLGGGLGVRFSPSRPPPRLRRQSSSLQRTCVRIVVEEGDDRNSTAYAGAESGGSWRDDFDCTRGWMTAMCLLDCMGGMTTMPSLLLRGIKDHNDSLSLL